MTAKRPTFPMIGEVKGSRVWRNAETGVEIIKGKNFAEVGLYYVCVPTQDREGRVAAAACGTLVEARAAATRCATGGRDWIADAHDEAVAEAARRGAAMLVEARRLVASIEVAYWTAQAVRDLIATARTSDEPDVALSAARQAVEVDEAFAILTRRNRGFAVA